MTAVRRGARHARATVLGFACTIAAATSSADTADGHVPRAALAAIADAHLEQWERCLSDNGASDDCLAGASERFEWRGPFGEALSLEDAADALRPDSPFRAAFARTTAWRRSIYVGASSVAYVADLFHECSNGVVGDDEMLSVLSVDPATRELERWDLGLYADHFDHTVARCNGGRTPAPERPQQTYVLEGKAVAALDALWDDEADAAPGALAENVTLCLSVLPAGRSCVRTRKAVLALLGARGRANSRAFTRRAVLGRGSAWLSWVAHGVCVDGTREQLEGELLYEIEPSTGAVTRITHVMDLHAVRASCQLADADADAAADGGRPGAQQNRTAPALVRLALNALRGGAGAGAAGRPAEEDGSRTATRTAAATISALILALVCLGILAVTAAMCVRSRPGHGPIGLALESMGVERAAGDELAGEHSAEYALHQGGDDDAPAPLLIPGMTSR